MIDRLKDKRIKFSLAVAAEGEAAFMKADRKGHLFARTVRDMCAMLGQAPLGRSLLKIALSSGTSAGLDPLLEPNSSYFYPQQNHIDLGYQPDLLLQTEKGFSRYLAAFTGALRRVWHYNAGSAADIILQPEGYLRNFRCCEADVAAVTVLVAWELRAAGQAGLWRYLLSGPEADLAASFSRMVESDPKNPFNGIALKTVFDQWFADRDRTNACDRAALENIDMALLRANKFFDVGKRILPPGTLQRVGQLPNGMNYLTGCVLTGAWYDGMDEESNRIYMRYLEKDISYLIDNKENT